MENENRERYVLEVVVTRLERIIKLLILLVLVACILLVVSNGLWLHAWAQYDYESETTETVYTQDGQGVNIIGDDNEVEHGPDKNGIYQEAQAN